MDEVAAWLRGLGRFSRVISMDQRGIGLEEQQRVKTPLDRIGAPADIADVVVFLCSDLARFVTGQNLVADGGMTLHGSGVDGVLDVVRDLLSGR